MPAKRTLTTKEKQLIKDLYINQRLGVKKICKELNCGRMLVRNYLEEEGIKRHSTGNQFKEVGIVDSELYNTWRMIKQRCYNSNHTNYCYYGARGITMYKPWIDDFPSFEEYVLTNLGPRPEGMTLDRIDTEKGNYEPGQIQWATDEEQNQTTRRTVLNEKLVRYIRQQRDSGAKMYIVAKEINVKYNTVFNVWHNKSWKNII